MSAQSVWSECLGFLPRKPVVVENSAGRLASDAGRLVVREFDERIRLTRQFAAALNDRRLQPTHSLLAMVRQRVSGILAGYDDQNDELLAQAVARYEQTHEPQRLFTALSYQAQTWDRARSVVLKAECHVAGTNRRAVVTNRRGALIIPQGRTTITSRGARARTATRNSSATCAAIG